MLDAFENRHVLILQGPAGPFFRRVSRELRKRGATIVKVNFNAADNLFYRGPEVVHFNDRFEAWPAFFRKVVEDARIEVVLLFGDCRPLHRVAIRESEELGLAVYVFEEGYLRPDFVTLERGGVAGFSSMPRDAEFFRRLRPEPLPQPRPVGNVLARATAYAIVYACTHGLFSWRYPHYRHHRCIRPFHQSYYWVRGALRRAIHDRRDAIVRERIAKGMMPPFFLVPLQVHLDSQMQHCSFGSVDEFIETVVRSFAEHAPRDTMLLIKDHPLGRPYRNYASLLDSLGKRYGLRARLRYVDMIHLPSTLRMARGTVVINSSVGLSSIHHGTPVKCLGTAVYDIPGLAFQGPLDDFWREPGQVDPRLYWRFRWWLRTNNQINGSIWRELWL